MSNSSKHIYFLFSVKTSRNSFPPCHLLNSHQIECQCIQIISSYDKLINLLLFSLLSTSGLRFPFGANKFKVFLSFITPYGESIHSKKPFHPKTNFLLPGYAIFTSGHDGENDPGVRGGERGDGEDHPGVRGGQCHDAENEFEENIFGNEDPM